MNVRSCGGRGKVHPILVHGNLRSRGIEHHGAEAGGWGGIGRDFLRAGENRLVGGLGGSNPCRGGSRECKCRDPFFHISPFLISSFHRLWVVVDYPYVETIQPGSQAIFCTEENPPPLYVRLRR